MVPTPKERKTKKVYEKILQAENTTVMRIVRRPDGERRRRASKAANVWRLSARGMQLLGVFSCEAEALLGVHGSSGSVWEV